MLTKEQQTKIFTDILSGDDATRETAVATLQKDFTDTETLVNGNLEKIETLATKVDELRAKNAEYFTRLIAEKSPEKEEEKEEEKEPDYPLSALFTD